MSFWKSTKAASIYTIYFFVIFILAFIQLATDGSPTTGMFIIIAVGISLMIILFFGVCRSLFKLNKENHVFLDALMLYLLAEISFLCMGGQISFFGLLYVFHMNDDLKYPVLNSFRERTELIFSSSALFLLFSILFKAC
ncbi:MAG: hypothetical protein JWQ85_3093 [Mucilaginibacter sp.]|nr:hypothetical protein [Mucilaginibacter sp.]